MNPDLSIIIVNWRSVDYLRECLNSIFGTAAGLAAEIVVVDNASYDGCEEMLASDYPQVRFVQSSRNLGFAGANNLAFRCASGRNILFLNPDTIILSDALHKMLSFLQSTRHAGIVGCRLLNSDHSLQISCVQAFPTITNQVIGLDVLRRRFPRLHLWGTRPLYDKSGPPAPVDAVSGACLMIRRDVFEVVNLFSSEYFMYAEDVDLCFKVKRAGWSVYVVPQATVVHHGGGSTAFDPRRERFAAVLKAESRYKYFRKNRGTAYAWIYRAAIAGASLLRLSLLNGLLLLSPERFGNGYVLSRVSRWSGVLRWAVGLEGWARELSHGRNAAEPA